MSWFECNRSFGCVQTAWQSTKKCSAGKTVWEGGTVRMWECSECACEGIHQHLTQKWPAACHIHCYVFSCQKMHAFARVREDYLPSSAPQDTLTGFTRHKSSSLYPSPQSEGSRKGEQLMMRLCLGALQLQCRKQTTKNDGHWKKEESLCEWSVRAG